MRENRSIMEVELPVVIQLPEMDPDAFIGYYRGRQAETDRLLLEKGAIKFRGVYIDSLNSFQRIVDSISDRFLNYIDGNSPRTRLSGNVYTSTEYDASQRITMHNELSYSAKWPARLFFSCLQPAETGGETLLADSRQILKKMDKAIVEEVMARGITYIRNLHGGEGLGPSWQETFETSDKEKVMEYCRSYGIRAEWRGRNGLRLVQSARGIINHRITGEPLWFNQIDQFHPCHLGPELLKTIGLLYDTPDNFPMFVRFGDGKEICESLVREILGTIEEVTVAPVWRTNELLLLDNELVSHGRSAYTGNRKVLVAMSE
jgi:hypothetical protein